jgi:molybdenum cofactor cytidylyltransferase
VNGIILAAGLSRRMGFPKALLLWHGETYLDRLIHIFSQVCQQVIVVLRPGFHSALATCRLLPSARIVFNHHADRGQFSSLQAGLDAVPDDRPVLFTPVDYGHIDSSIVLHLAAAFSPADSVLQPQWRGRSGHPLLVSPAVADALRAEPSDSNARSVIHRFPRRFLDTQDPGVVMDADDPESFRAIQEARQ